MEKEEEKGRSVREGKGEMRRRKEGVKEGRRKEEGRCSSLMNSGASETCFKDSSDASWEPNEPLCPAPA